MKANFVKLTRPLFTHGDIYSTICILVFEFKWYLLNAFYQSDKSNFFHVKYFFFLVLEITRKIIFCRLNGFHSCGVVLDSSSFKFIGPVIIPHIIVH